MSNFNKEELLAKEEADIRSIAQELGIELKNNEEKEDIIYRILDEQAIRSINDRSSEPKKRTRIAATKKEAQKVVTANGNTTTTSKNAGRTRKKAETETPAEPAKDTAATQAAKAGNGALCLG